MYYTATYTYRQLKMSLHLVVMLISPDLIRQNKIRARLNSPELFFRRLPANTERLKGSDYDFTSEDVAIINSESIFRKAG